MTKLKTQLITIVKNTKGRFTERWISLSLLATTALITLLFTFFTRAPITPHVAFLDTAFCPQALKENLPNGVELELVQNLETAQTICSLSLTHPMRHGDRVLLTYLKNLAPEVKAHKIHLYGLFTLTGKINAKSWLRAATDAIARGNNIIASAVAAPVEAHIEENLPLREELLIVASGQWGGAIKENQILVPQELIRKNEELRSKSLVIGAYFLDQRHQEAYLDHTLLYQDLINYSFAISDEGEEGEHRVLAGSSYALAVALARLMNFCAQEVGDIKGVKECLENKRVSVDTVDGRTLYQF